MKKLIKISISICLLLTLLIIITNIIIIGKSTYYIDNDINYKNYDYVLVLGASAKNNRPSLMLKDRLDKVVEIYNENKNIKIILSGDSVKENYDETGVMYNYLTNSGINSNNIIIDKYGVSTYDSVVRIKDITKDKKVIIVTQKYHLYRSIYIAKQNNINVVGVKAYEYKYFGNLKREIREVLARTKDYFYCLSNHKIEYENNLSNK
mgnify:CR=1 FL=1